jgi:YD repeat-containing protein
MNRILTGLLLIGFLAVLGGKASASYTSIDLSDHYSFPPTGSESTNVFWRYNVARQLDHLVKPDGTIVSNIYDSVGRLITMKAMKEGGSDEILYAYDEAGRVGSISRAGNAIQYSYDAFLQTGEQTPAGTVSRECAAPNV